MSADLLEHERRMLEEEGALLRRLERELRAGWHSVSGAPTPPTPAELDTRERAAAADLERRRRQLAAVLELIIAACSPAAWRTAA